MLNRELLIAGASGGGIYGVGAVHEYHGFRLQRANTGNGSIITYKAADGTLKDMLVLDAKYRSVQRFGTYRTDVPGLTNFQSQGADGSYVTGKTIISSGAMPDFVTNDAIYNNWHTAFAADKTAKENCDIWMTYNNQTDSQGIKGVPAVAWCRNQIVDDKPCDLPNMYEAMVIFACGDQLDEMDPTTSGYPDLRLGYTSTTAYPPFIRCQKFNGQTSSGLFSSTEYNSEFMRVVDYYGTCNTNGKSNVGTAVPVLEL